MSDPIRAGQAHLIVFALVSAVGVPVAGLGTGFTLTISKNGGAFAASTGTKAEISGGWYSYELTASETDTVGPLAVKITGAGAVQNNLTYQVDWAAYAAPAGTYILTATEASDVLRCAIDDPVMLALLPAIDAYIKRATGRNWAAETITPEEAKNAARILLVQWHEDPGMMASGGAVLSGGLSACLTQLEAMALYYFTFEGLDGGGYIHVHHIHEGDSVVNVVGKVGATGDQSSKFESVITEHGYILQTSAENLDEKWFMAFIKPPQEM